MRALTCLTAVAALMLAACDKPPVQPIPTEDLPPPATEPPPVMAPTSGAACKSGDLVLTHLSDDAGAGQRHVVYALTNSSKTACTLKGFVTAAWFDVDGKPLDGVSVVQTEGGEPPAEVTVAPAGRAVFTISYTGIQATDKLCVDSRTMHATPPGNDQVIQIEDRISPCTDHISLQPIRAEQPGDDQTAT